MNRYRSNPTFFLTLPQCHIHISDTNKKRVKEFIRDLKNIKYSTEEVTYDCTEDPFANIETYMILYPDKTIPVDSVLPDEGYEEASIKLICPKCKKSCYNYCSKVTTEFQIKNSKTKKKKISRILDRLLMDSDFISSLISQYISFSESIITHPYSLWSFYNSLNKNCE